MTTPVTDALLAAAGRHRHAANLQAPAAGPAAEQWA